MHCYSSDPSFLITIKNTGKEICAYLDDIFNDRSTKLTNNFYEIGGILFRGFNIDSQEKFYNLVNKFKEFSTSYKDGNSPRTRINDLVYTSTEYPKEYMISLHNELSYSSSWPRYLMFCCLQPAISGGETPLADCRKILQQLPGDVVNIFKSKGLKYIRNLVNKKGLGKSWQATFECDYQEEVACYCEKNNIYYKWIGDNNLCTQQIGQTIIKHPKTGEYVWFNQPSQFHPYCMPPEIYSSLELIYGEDPLHFPHHVVHADNSKIDTKHLDIITEVSNNNSNYFSWQTGDVLFIDNILLSHGRMSYRGERKILVSCF